ncbi:MAG: DUF2141 domain-containing protein [Chlorobiaceae bacterium]|jgi:uncharacterized protein (DUF2141 family)
MKKFVTLIITLLFAATGSLLAEEVPPASVTSQPFGSITVNITDINKPDGILGVSLYNSKKGFPGKHENACANQLKKITSTEDKVVFNNIPYGTYAVSIMHDENSNGKLETNFFGIPKEGVGVSNNPKIGMGGPKFKDSEFILDTKQLELTVAMKYFNRN